jgi:hypothetical protein
MRLHADEGTSIDQCIDRPALKFGPRPGINSPTEISGFGSPHYSNKHDNPVENGHGSIRDPNTCPIPLQSRLVFGTLTTITTSRQPLVGKEREGSVLNIAEVVSESTPEPATISVGACSNAGVQGDASAELITSREPIIDHPIALRDIYIPSNNSAPARSLSRIASYQSCRKTFAEFSYIEIPNRYIAEGNRPLITITPLTKRD